MHILVVLELTLRISEREWSRQLQGKGEFWSSLRVLLSRFRDVVCYDALLSPWILQSSPTELPFLSGSVPYSLHKQQSVQLANILTLADSSHLHFILTLVQKMQQAHTRLQSHMARKYSSC